MPSKRLSSRDFITSPTENGMPGSAEENLIPVVLRTGIVLVSSCTTISLVFSSSSFDQCHLYWYDRQSLGFEHDTHILALFFNDDEKSSAGDGGD